jgi:hypothetical protein
MFSGWNLTSPDSTGAQRRSRQLAHLQEPLHRQSGLNHGVGPLRAAHARAVPLRFQQVATGLEFLYERYAGLVAVHTDEELRVLVQRTVGIEQVDDLQTVLLPNLVVVHVVGRGNLQRPRAKLHVDVLVKNDRNLPVHHRHDHLHAVILLIALVVGMNGQRRIRRNGFRTAGGNHDVFIFRAGYFVADGVEVFVFVGVNNLLVRQDRLGHGVPVGHPQSAVEFSFLVKVNENLDDRCVEPGLHGEAGALPVAAGAQLLQLVQDFTAVLLLPGEGVFEEFFPADIRLLDALIAQLLHHLGFRSDACVVGTGNPAGVLAVQARLTNQHVLNGVVQHVPHVQHARDVRWRDHNGVGLPLVGFAVEIVLLQPVLVPFRFNFVGLIRLWGGHGREFWRLTSGTKRRNFLCLRAAKIRRPTWFS